MPHKICHWYGATLHQTARCYNFNFAGLSRVRDMVIQICFKVLGHDCNRNGLEDNFQFDQKCKIIFILNPKWSRLQHVWRCDTRPHINCIISMCFYGDNFFPMKWRIVLGKSSQLAVLPSPSLLAATCVLLLYRILMCHDFQFQVDKI